MACFQQVSPEMVRDGSAVESPHLTSSLYKWENKGREGESLALETETGEECDRQRYLYLNT